MKDKTIAFILIIILAIAVAAVIGATSYADRDGYYSQQGYGSMMGGMGGNMMGSGMMSGSMMGSGMMVPYTDDLLKRAITKGIDANGESLDPTMPRWYMPEKDLNDLVTYIKTLQTEVQK